MVKARPVAGDLDLGREFLDAIRPFVWRRGLDFAAVADIHAMKRRIDTQTLSRTHSKHGAVERPTGDALTRIAGHNVKLGEGGIREIEFVAQTLQLVWGGRDPGLRVPARPWARLRALARAGLLARRTATELSSSYRFLRQVEHRIQMVADRQTHSLPEKPAELARIAVFLGYPDAPRFRRGAAAPSAAGAARLPRGVRAGARPAGRVPGSAANWISAAMPTRRRQRWRCCVDLGFTQPDRIVAAVRVLAGGTAARAALAACAGTDGAGAARDPCGAGAPAAARCRLHPVRRVPRKAAGRGAVAVAVPAQPGADRARRRRAGRRAQPGGLPGQPPLGARRPADRR